jgi:hypothetical protein
MMLFIASCIGITLSIGQPELVSIHSQLNSMVFMAVSVSHLF